jgi:hypothetical protein
MPYFTGPKPPSHSEGQPVTQPLMFEVKVTAMGEVRDADGNLISSTPVETTMHLTEEQVRELTQGGTP